MAWTWRVFWPEQSRKKSVNAGVWRRSRTTTSWAFLSSAAFTAFAMSPVSFFFAAARGFFSALAIVETVLMDVGFDERRQETGERLAALQPRADRGRRHVGSRRLEQEDQRARVGSRRRAGGTHARPQVRQPLRECIDVVAGPRHDDEMGEVEHVGVTLPGGDVG